MTCGVAAARPHQSPWSGRGRWPGSVDRRRPFRPGRVPGSSLRRAGRGNLRRHPLLDDLGPPLHATPWRSPAESVDSSPAVATSGPDPASCDAAPIVSGRSLGIGEAGPDVFDVSAGRVYRAGGTHGRCGRRPSWRYRRRRALAAGLRAVRLYGSYAERIRLCAMRPGLRHRGADDRQIRHGAMDRRRRGLTRPRQASGNGCPPRRPERSRSTGVDPESPDHGTWSPLRCCAVSRVMRVYLRRRSPRCAPSATAGDRDAPGRLARPLRWRPTGRQWSRGASMRLGRSATP